MCSRHQGRPEPGPSCPVGCPRESHFADASFSPACNTVPRASETSGDREGNGSVWFCCFVFRKLCWEQAVPWSPGALEPRGRTSSRPCRPPRWHVAFCVDCPLQPVPFCSSETHASSPRTRRAQRPGGCCIRLCIWTPCAGLEKLLAVSVITSGNDGTLERCDTYPINFTILWNKASPLLCLYCSSPFQPPTPCHLLEQPQDALSEDRDPSGLLCSLELSGSTFLF